jgi:putative redox protein
LISGIRRIGMRVQLKQVQGITFAGLSETGHWTVMDSVKEFGGSQGAVKPMELILMGLGGCSGMDVVSILNKMRLPLEDMKIEVDADQKEDHPRMFTRIRMHYIFYGQDLDKEKVEKAIELSRMKYCSVWAMLVQVVDIQYTYEFRSKKE